MQIRIRKTRTGVKVSIKAKKGREGEHLAKAVLAHVGHGETKVTTGLLASICKSLAEQGYTAPGLVEGETPAVVDLIPPEVSL